MANANVKPEIKDEAERLVYRLDQGMNALRYWQVAELSGGEVAFWIEREGGLHYYDKKCGHKLRASELEVGLAVIEVIADARVLVEEDHNERKAYERSL